MKENKLFYNYKPTLFNLALEHITRKINKGTIRTGGKQIIAYADDLALVAKNRTILTETLQEIITEGEKIGLRINEDKTKLMRIGKKQKIKYLKLININLKRSKILNIWE